jgi:hypothetical protein
LPAGVWRRRQRRLDQDRHNVSLLQERGGGEDPRVGDVIPFLRIGGSDHGVEFPVKLDGLGSLAVIISAHRRCNRRREGGSPLGFERSGNDKKLRL